MNIKHWLILVPALLIMLMMQAYFWIPTYDTQAEGNRARLTKYIVGSIADAKLINPTLYSDASSAEIADMIFDGLITLDENLKLRGNLAESWQVSEDAYLLVRTDHTFPDGVPVTAQELLSRLQAKQAEWLGQDANLLETIEIIPQEKQSTKITISKLSELEKAEPSDIPVQLTVPERIHFHLNRVDQDFFMRMTAIVGENYFQPLDYNKYITGYPAALADQLQPHFSELIAVSEHNPVLVFNLRKGVSFHDGHPFTAKDVKFTYEAILDTVNLSPRRADFEPIKSVTILDDYQVKVVYKQLYSPAVSDWTMGILPEHLLNKAALNKEFSTAKNSQPHSMRESKFNRFPIGTGPFKMVEWQNDEFIHLRANDQYWEGKPEYQDYYFRVIPDYLTQEVEFQAGALDYYAALPHQVARYKTDPKYQSFSSIAFQYSYIGYNLRSPLFSDKRVRQALGMAINVDEIIQYLLYGEGERVTGPFPKDTPWYNERVAPLPYDPEQAKALLKEAGWVMNSQGWLEKDGRRFEFNLITNSGNPQRKNIMTIVQHAWERIGIKCNTQAFEWTVFLQDFVDKGAFDAIVLGWTNSPLNFDLYQIFHSSQTHPQELNFVGYQNPQIDELIVRIRQEFDPAKQQNIAQQIHQIIYEDQPYTFLYAPRSTRVLDKKIVIVEKTSDGQEKYKQIYPTKGGIISYYFRKWRKLEHVPDF